MPFTSSAAVAQDPTTVAGSCVPLEVTSGRATVCTATVDDSNTDPVATAPPSGTVTFTAPDGSGSFAGGGSTAACALTATGSATSDCSVTFTASATTAAVVTLALAYGGDGSHFASDGDAYVDVAPPDMTSVSIACAPNDISVGAASTCTVTVLDQAAQVPATGTVTVSAATTELGNGGTCVLAPASANTATCRVTVTVPTAGDQVLTASYPGDASHLPSHGQFTLNVADPTATRLSCQPTTLAVKATTSCTAVVTDTATVSATPPTGKVSFELPPKWATTSLCTLAAQSASSSCQLTLTPTSSGSFTVAAFYSGDASHLASRAQQTVVVQKSSSGSPSQPKPVSSPPGASCTDTYPSTSSGADRLMLSHSSSSDPLSGARLFVNGPAHGYAAGAIARLLGIDPHTPVGQVLAGVPETESWAAFKATIPGLEAKLGNQPSIDHEVALLEKIASEPETQRISSFSEGGGAGAIYGQTEKLFCHNFVADPHAIPVISTYFLHPVLGGCASSAQIQAYQPTFRRRVNELSQAIGNRPAVLLVETDGIGSSSCMARRGDLSSWLAQIRYEDLKLISLPHTLVYVEAGYSDSNSPAYTAGALKKVGISKITGFWTNDTHINWTINEIHWGEAVSKLAGGAHFIVNTAQNGDGPLLNKHPTTEGTEDLCNPPGRGLGPPPTASTRFARVDAFVWSSPPGISSGQCQGGPASGTFWLARAVSLAANADDRLGPAYPNRPY